MTSEDHNLQVNTPGEWRVKISMEISQISMDMKEMKESFRDISKMEHQIYDRIQSDYAHRFISLEKVQAEQGSSHANLSGQFKVVSSLMALAVAALFTWVASSQPEPSKPKVVIKLDRSTVKKLER